MYVVFATACVAVLFTAQPTNDPPAGAAHLSPVASELSATNPRTISEDCARDQVLLGQQQ